MRKNKMGLNKNQYRQGDVFLISATIPKDAAVVESKEKGRLTLAYGEVTGHSHRLEFNGDPEAFAKTAGGISYISVKSPVELKHEEHSHPTIPAGDYIKAVQVEYTPKEIVRVTD